MQNIAENIISKCGGRKVVAEITGVDVSRVGRWTKPKEQGGSNGLIPVQHHQRLLEGARALGVDLSPQDFFETVEGNKDA